MKNVSIDPEELTKGGGSLRKLGGELESGGGKLAEAGQRLAQHAARDKSGVGKVITEIFGRGTQIAGDVIKEGGRVVKKSGQHLHETGQAHRENDHWGKERFDQIRDDGKGPRARGGTSGPGRTGTGGATTPPHKPPSPPGGGGPGGSGRNLGPSWRDEVNKNFSPDEQKDLRRAMRKISEEPNDRGVPGSGRLTQHERELLARAQTFVTIDKDTPMQKVIPESQVRKYLNPERDASGYAKPSEIGGFVARQQDATHLNTPNKIVDGNRLDYAKTPFSQGMDKVHVVEFPAGNPAKYQIPIGAPVNVDHGALPKDPSVRHASDHMRDAMDGAGFDQRNYGQHNNPWPYTGAGVTAHPDGVPERYKAWGEIPHDSKLVEYDPSGNRVETHTYDANIHEWIPI